MRTFVLELSSRKSLKLVDPRLSWDHWGVCRVKTSRLLLLLLLVSGGHRSCRPGCRKGLRQQTDSGRCMYALYSEVQTLDGLLCTNVKPGARAKGGMP